MGIQLATKVFENGFTKAMFGVYTVQQFQFHWDRMIETTFTSEGTDVHSWLHFIYNFREQWSSAWVNKNFTCGIRSSQLSESLNSSLRAYLDTKTNLPTFFVEFSRMLDNKRDDELYQDYLVTNRQVTNFFPKNLLVTQASESYSPKIFTNFQEEYANSMDLIMKGGIPLITQGINNTFTWFKYSMANETFDNDEHTVTLKLDTWFYHCSCDKFDSSGWLCRHIMKTMDQISSFGFTDAWTIPKDYLLDRWSTNAKIGGAIYGSTVECLDMETQFGRFRRLCSSSLPLATDASQYVEITDFVEEQLKQLHEDVCAQLLHLRVVDPTKTPSKQKGKCSNPVLLCVGKYYELIVSLFSNIYKLIVASASTPKDDDLLTTTGFKMRVNPNKSSKRMKSSNEKIKSTNEKKRKQKKLVEDTVREFMDRHNK
ncbi:Protein FAR1-RELATED SEQUENCE 9 [Linum perenne]